MHQSSEGSNSKKDLYDIDKHLKEDEELLKQDKLIEEMVFRVIKDKNRSFVL
jgi:hypothetical protein